ncbi:hypothetical protein TMU01_30180 [Tenuibacillus multivorans]|nr:hypothetical protein [Tenuibacillus multivorans]GEL78783.1 hypothetical protein TMU01_30180 [Tenuibacillus multivorans]
MLGMMVSEQEQKEIEYLLRREMDELIFDFNYQNMDKQVKEAIKERYTTLFNIFRRIANHSSCLQYTPKKNFPHVN